jgi:hypothetical protein
MTRIYAYCRDASFLAIWGWLVPPTLVREIEERDPWDYDDGRDCPGGDA